MFSPIPLKQEVIDVESDSELILDTNIDSHTIPVPPKSPRFRLQETNGEIQVVVNESQESRALDKQSKEPLFWTFVLICSWLALGVLSLIALYLSRTDFFASHQNDLLGTVVDERFTVVADQHTSANIFLKSGRTQRLIS